MRGRVGAVLGYWRAERRTIRQGFVALVVASLGNLIAGLTLGSITGTLERLPGLMVLVPAAIGMRGNIFGALGSRLGTSVHTGLFEATRRREGVLYQNVAAASVLTLAISLGLGVLAKALSVAFGITSISLADFVVISILGGVLSSVVVALFAVALAVRAFRRGWDLDSVAAPLVTAVGDVVTLPALFLASFAVGVPGVTPAVGTAALVAMAWAAVWGLRTDLPVTRRVVRHGLVLLLVAGGIDVFAGLVMEARLDRLAAFPVLLVLIPPFLADAGALGSILSSRLASKLHLGALTPRGRPEPAALLDTTIIFLFSVWLFALVGFSADVVATLFGLASPGPLRVLGISLLGGLIATAFAVVVAYYAATATFRMGLDPDDFGIPIITSTMDFLGVISLFMALAAFGVA
ncbi:MAG TPA: magnesium transporter [Actinomycetota bacterium]|jgi:mgtE-like transporter